MSQYDTTFDLKINVDHWPTFHGPVILPYILKTIWCMNIVYSVHKEMQRLDILE